MSLLKTLRLTSVHWHRFLAWIGAALLLLYILSALTHPLLSWTGPKAAHFFPPKAAISAEHLHALTRIVQQQQITRAQVIKVIPAQDAVLLQVTPHNDLPRRYFDLATGEELPDYDEQYARWLGRYYLGNNSATVTHITKQDHFDNSYPWVNRLLPVYKIQYATADNKTLYIYTELAALASISNDWKRSLQTLFQWLHTWSWLDSNDTVRVILVGLFVGTLLLFILAGIGLLFSFKARKIIDAKRRWHRRIAYIVWLPLLGLSASGFYHLLQSAYGDNTSGLKITQQLKLPQQAPTHHQQDQLAINFAALPQTLHHISLVNDNLNNPLYRIGLPPAASQVFKQNHTEKQTQQIEKSITNKQRYQGIATERGALYFTLEGTLANWSDEDATKQVAADYLNTHTDSINHTRLITHFSPEYDFRNKRLPVWQINFDNTAQDSIFIDPITGIVVDHTTQITRYERYSFSLLHKWNFLVPLMGRQNRDIVVIAILSLSLLMIILGIALRIKQRYNTRKGYRAPNRQPSVNIHQQW